ncbi:MAG: hypothetical protein ACXWCU_17335 [Caldimonas sp.]
MALDDIVVGLQGVDLAAEGEPEIASTVKRIRSVCRSIARPSAAARRQRRSSRLQTRTSAGK